MPFFNPMWLDIIPISHGKITAATEPEAMIIPKMVPEYLGNFSPAYARMVGQIPAKNRPIPQKDKMDIVTLLVTRLMSIHIKAPIVLIKMSLNAWSFSIAQLYISLPSIISPQNAPRTMPLVESFNLYSSLR